MQFKKYTKQRNRGIQGLRSLKDTLPKNIKKIINNRGHVYSETLNNWKYIAGESLFKVCYPKSYKNSNKFSDSTLVIMVQRGHEVELEYSKKDIMDRMNSFFEKSVVKRIKLTTFNDENKNSLKDDVQEDNVTNNKYQIKVKSVKNEKIRNSLIELTKVFKKK
tara:strand:+ start:17 stop:505 length:489 start_codon:yes stop_codon:yes gene_type:complete